MPSAPVAPKGEKASATPAEGRLLKSAAISENKAVKLDTAGLPLKNAAAGPATSTTAQPGYELLASQLVQPAESILARSVPVPSDYADPSQTARSESKSTTHGSGVPPALTAPIVSARAAVPAAVSARAASTSAAVPAGFGQDAATPAKPVSTLPTQLAASSQARAPLTTDLPASAAAKTSPQAPLSSSSTTTADSRPQTAPSGGSSLPSSTLISKTASSAAAPPTESALVKHDPVSATPSSPQIIAQPTGQSATPATLPIPASPTMPAATTPAATEGTSSHLENQPRQQSSGNVVARSANDGRGSAAASQMQQQTDSRTIIAAVRAAVSVAPPAETLPADAAATSILPHQAAIDATTRVVEAGSGSTDGKAASRPPAALRTSPLASGHATRPNLPASPQVEPTGPAARVSTVAAKPTERGDAASRNPHKSDAENSVASASSESAGSTSASASAGAATTTIPQAAGSIAPGLDANATAAALTTPQPAPAASQPLDGDKHDASTDAAIGATGAAADPHALPAINTARVLQTMQGSEMRVGMHSAEFGNVSVSTSLNRQTIAAQISFEHMDLGKALTAHLPSIEAKLSSEYGMHAKVEVRDQSMGADSGRGESRRGDGGTSHTAGTNSPSSMLAAGVEAPTVNNNLNMVASESPRLDIQA